MLSRREKPRRQIHVKYNNWELEGEGGAWLDLEHTDAPHDQGADWWCAATCPSTCARQATVTGIKAKEA